MDNLDSCSQPEKEGRGGEKGCKCQAFRGTDTTDIPNKMRQDKQARTDYCTAMHLEKKWRNIS